MCSVNHLPLTTHSVRPPGVRSSAVSTYSVRKANAKVDNLKKEIEKRQLQIEVAYDEVTHAVPDPPTTLLDPHFRGRRGMERRALISVASDRPWR